MRKEAILVIILLVLASVSLAQVPDVGKPVVVACQDPVTLKVIPCGSSSGSGTTTQTHAPSKCDGDFCPVTLKACGSDTITLELHRDTKTVTSPDCPGSVKCLAVQFRCDSIETQRVQDDYASGIIHGQLCNNYGCWDDTTPFTLYGIGSVGSGTSSREPSNLLLRMQQQLENLQALGPSGINALLGDADQLARGNHNNPDALARINKMITNAEAGLTKPQLLTGFDTRLGVQESKKLTVKEDEDFLNKRAIIPAGPEERAMVADAKQSWDQYHGLQQPLVDAENSGDQAKIDAAKQAIRDKIEEVWLKNARVLDQYPNDPDANLMLGTISQYFRKDFGAAEEYYRRALLNAPQDQTQQIMDSLKDPAFKQAAADQAVKRIAQASADDSWQLQQAVAAGSHKSHIWDEMTDQFDSYVQSQADIHDTKEMAAAIIPRIMTHIGIVDHVLGQHSSFFGFSESFWVLANYDVTFNYKENK